MTATKFMLVFAAAKLGIHLFTSQGYGYFRDELYYIACSEHLDWGYVDHPAFSIFVLHASRAVLGELAFRTSLRSRARRSGDDLSRGRDGVDGGRWAIRTGTGHHGSAGSTRVLFPAGALLVESWISRRSLRIAILAALTAGGVATAPLALPVLSVNGHVAYARALAQAPTTEERKELGSFPTTTQICTAGRTSSKN